MRQFLSIIIISICLFAGFYSFLIAQPVLKKIIGAEGRPGERIEINLIGENLKQVVRVEAVRFDNDKINVLDYHIESDQLIRIEMRIPFGAEPGRHKIAVLVADAETKRWLEPISENENTTIIQHAEPEIEILYNANLFEEGDELYINFIPGRKGFVSKAITIKNHSNMPVSVSNPKLPPELILIGQFPKDIAPGGSHTFQLQLNSNALDAFSGEIQFSLNENDETPYILRINGKVEQPSSSEADLDTAVIQPSIVFDTTSNWSQSRKPLIIKNESQNTITINRLRLPDGFVSSDTIPANIPAGDSTIFHIQLDPDLLTAFDGRLQFDITNIAENPTAFRITAAATLNLTAAIEIYDSVDSTIAGQLSPVNFGNTPIGVPIQRIFSIRNKGDMTLRLSDLKMPPGFTLVGDTFPLVVEAGGSRPLTVELNTDRAQSISDSITFNTNVVGQSSISIPVTGSVQAMISADITEKRQPFSWTPIIIAVITLSVGLGGGYYLLRSPVREFRIKKSLAGKTNFQFKPKLDDGFQTIKQSTPIKPDFEMCLKPFPDYGKQTIKFKKALIRDEVIQPEKSQSTRPDDLTRIEGIGPVISGILHESGITTFRQLAETDVKRIQQMLRSAGITGIADPATWPMQAELAASKEWKQLDKLQEELKGGRVVHEKV